MSEKNNVYNRKHFYERIIRNNLSFMPPTDCNFMTLEPTIHFNNKINDLSSLVFQIKLDLLNRVTLYLTFKTKTKTREKKDPCVVVENV